MNKTRIGVIGKGHVGSALARGLAPAGYGVRPSGSSPAEVREVAGKAEVIILAVPFGAIDSVLEKAGAALDGKALVDVTNALGPEMQWALGFTISGAEELQKKASSKVVLEMARAIGFDAVDAGPLRNARMIEALGYLNIQLGYVLGLGTQIGFKLLHAEN